MRCCEAGRRSGDGSQAMRRAPDGEALSFCGGCGEGGVRVRPVRRYHAPAPGVSRGTHPRWLQ